jgi:hypothetical protein
MTRTAKGEAPAPRRRRRWLLVAAAVVAALVAFVAFWFQPQKLFIDDRVEEALPVATGPSSPTGHPEPSAGNGADRSNDQPVEPTELLRGDFVSLDHGTRGVVRLLEIGDGTRVVRLEGLDTDNGPDLYLYLTATPAKGEESTFDDDYISLGRLKGNQGDQNYELPPDVDPERYTTVVIWCDRFNSAFGAADLA